MKSSDEHVAAILADSSALSASARLDYIRTIVVPLLESAGFDYARETGNRFTSTLFIVANDLDKRLKSLSNEMARCPVECGAG